MNKLALLVPLVFGGLGVLPLYGCSSNYNRAERNAAPEAQSPHTDYANMSIDELKLACIGPEHGLPPSECTPDPGSRTLTSTWADALRDTQFVWVWNLNNDGAPDMGRARATYTYDDNTALFVVPERDQRSNANGAPRNPDVAAADAGWMPQAEPITPLDGLPFSRAIRFKGGPFTEYGGGFGQSFRTASNHDGEMIDGNGGSITLPSSPEFPSATNGAYDLSSYDGVAIWVRRGPLGMSTLRVGITEKNSAEDLNSGAVVEAAGSAELAPGISEGKHCRRWRLCGCAAGTPCVDGRCWDPAWGDVPLTALTCGEAKCREVNTSTTFQDPLYAKVDAAGDTSAACNQYTTSDGRSDMFCYDPAIDPPPPAKRERCNNPFSRPVTVTTDWQLIKVPFSELLQADEGYVARDKDLTSVKQIVVTHGAGWTDFWIANVGFYQTTK